MFCMNANIKVADAQVKMSQEQITALNTGYWLDGSKVTDSEMAGLRKIQSATTQSSQASQNSTCDIFGSAFISCSFAKIGSIILSLVSLVLYMAGTSLDFAINASLNMSKLVSDIPMVDIGWKLLLNITNLLYIFILLFVAINMILGNSTYGNKSLIAQVIITAVLVNFSLFATKVMVDASNIVAIQFYNMMQPNSNQDQSMPSGISASFMNTLNMQSVYQSAQDANGVGNTIPGVTDFFGKAGDAGFGKVIAVTVLGSLFILATAIVFFAGALMFITRSITLLILMMFSSLAIASRALPSTKKHFDDWFHKLLDNCIFAPVFLGLLYILISAIKGKNGNGINFASMILNGNGVGGLVSYLMIIGSLVGILLISKKLGVAGSEFAHGFIDKRFGKDNWFGTRKIIGRPATAIAESNAARFASRYIPGLSKPLSSVRKITGRDEVETEKKAHQKFVDGTSTQGAFEPDSVYKKRKELSKNRSLNSLGLGKDGKIKHGPLATPVEALKRMLGGRAYTDLQVAKAKEIKAEAKNKNLAISRSLAIARGLTQSTGITNLLTELKPAIPATGNSPAVPAVEEDNENSMIELQRALNSNDFSIQQNGTVNVGTLNMTAGSDLSDAYLAWNAANTANPIIPAVRAQAKKELDRQVSAILAKLKTYTDAKDRLADKEDKKEDKK